MSKQYPIYYRVLNNNTPIDAHTFGLVDNMCLCTYEDLLPLGNNVADALISDLKAAFIVPSEGNRCVIYFNKSVQESTYKEIIMAHEYGHFVNKHIAISTGRILKQETEADAYAANVYGKQSVIDFLKDLLKEDPNDYELILRINALQ